MHLLPIFISLFSLLFGNDEAELIFVGDAMQHQGQLDAARRPDGSYDYSDCFRNIAPEVTMADYAVVNLETPIGSSNFTGYPCFNAPASFVHALRDAGFDLFLTANNHTLDRRDRGLHATIDSLDAAGVDHIGTYHNAAARDSILPMVRTISGIRVGFLNYTYGTNGIEISGEAVVDYIDRPTIKTDIERLRDAGAEIVTVAMHWGDEYRMVHNSNQAALADFLVDAGADLVIGAHPHVIQPMEVRHNEATGRDVLVVYSLGNFISNMKTRDTRGGAMLKVRLVRGADGVARFESAAYRLLFTLPRGESGNYELVQAEDYTGPWSQACDAFVRSAESILSKHNINVSKAR